MKKTAISVLTVLACSMGIVASVHAQPQQSAQEYNFPSRDGSYSPPSTLRITEQPQAGAAPVNVVRDTPESLDKYTRCRNNADREAIGHLQLQAMVAACLNELAQRRQP